MVISYARNGVRRILRDEGGKSDRLLVEPNGLRLPLNQQHIADALGLSLVHTNKTLKRLHAAGLYTLKDGRLRLVNPAAMARLADYYALPLRPRPLI